MSKLINCSNESGNLSLVDGKEMTQASDPLRGRLVRSDSSSKFILLTELSNTEYSLKPDDYFWDTCPNGDHCMCLYTHKLGR